MISMVVEQITEKRPGLTTGYLTAISLNEHYIESITPISFHEYFDVYIFVTLGFTADQYHCSSHYNWWCKYAPLW